MNSTTKMAVCARAEITQSRQKVTRDFSRSRRKLRKAAAQGGREEGGGEEGAGLLRAAQGQLGPLRDEEFLEDGEGGGGQGVGGGQGPQAPVAGGGDGGALEALGAVAVGLAEGRGVGAGGEIDDDGDEDGDGRDVVEDGEGLQAAVLVRRGGAGVLQVLDVQRRSVEGEDVDGRVGEFLD